jgi:hypothetical protein
MEKFVKINGYNGVYEISSLGNVISNNFGKKKILKHGIMTSGYKMVSLKKDGKQKMFSIHRLLAIAFIDNPNTYPQVNHKDGNKLNNDLSNLEWCTRSQNIQHMYDSGLKTYIPLHNKGKFGKDHNRSKSVRCIETGVVYGSMSEAGRLLNINHSSVSWSIKNKRPIYGMHFEIGE